MSPSGCLTVTNPDFDTTKNALVNHPGLEVAKIRQIDANRFQRPCVTIGISDFHFHNLRHPWASWHVQGGTPLMVLKKQVSVGHYSLSATSSHNMWKNHKN
jgi:integrase